MTKSIDILIYPEFLEEWHSAELSDDEAGMVKKRVMLTLNLKEMDEYEATQIWVQRDNWLRNKIKSL